MGKHLVFRNPKTGKFQKVNYGAVTTIKGKKYDKAMIVAAECATAGRGDGRINGEKDVKMLAKAIRPGGMGVDKKGKDKAKGNATYDKREKSSLAYIRKKSKMTAKADKLLRKFIRHEGGQQAAATKKRKAMKTKK